MQGALRTYWIGWSLLVASLICWSAAAIYFEYTNHAFIISTLLQAAGVLLALAVAYFFFEHRSQVRQEKIDATVNSTVDSLRILAKNAVITAVQQWKEHPYRHSEYGSDKSVTKYEEARRFVLERSRLLTNYEGEIDSYGSLHWVFMSFEELALYCGQSFRTVGPALMESGALIRAMVNLEAGVESEKRVWEEFRIRMNNPNAPLPQEASYNLLVVAELTIRLVDVFDSKDLNGDPEYEATRRFAPPVFRRSHQWGEWR